MENPVKTIASTLTPGKLVGGAVLFIAVAAIFDVAGFTNWLLFPVTTAKAKFFSKSPA